MHVYVTSLHLSNSSKTLSNPRQRTDTLSKRFPSVPRRQKDFDFLDGNVITELLVIDADIVPAVLCPVLINSRDQCLVGSVLFQRAAISCSAYG